MVVVVGLTIVYVQDLNRGPALKKHPDIEKETCLKVRKGGFWGGGWPEKRVRGASKIPF